MILDTIKADIIKAMKENKPVVRDTLRYVLSKIQQVEVDTRKDVTEEQVIQLIKTTIKQNEDTLKFNPVDKQKLETEIVIWNYYLPKQLSESETKLAIELIIKGHSITSAKQMGLVMKELRAKFPGTVDMGLASKLTKQILS